MVPILIVALTLAFWRRARWAGGLLMPYAAWVWLGWRSPRC
ncbi:hypothetical protein [Paraburkholderia sp. BL6669N2]|nr:hypothetical protein [Paraburkholderia sp. BL6669N2]